jgi:hypothetical protein
MKDISGFGIRVRVIASRTFPAGVTLTQFADDADPFDTPEITVAETAMGVNGDLIIWSKANPIMVALNVIPNSEDDRNLAILLEANRVARGKRGARDVITLSAIYPDGTTKTMNSGAILTGRPANSIASAGRMKSKPYGFAFEGSSGQG